MKKILIKNIDTLVSCDEKDNVYKNTNILIEDGVIRDISNTEYEDCEIIDAKGMIVYPGLINTHHHLYQTFTRNIMAVQNMELFDWLTHLYNIWQHIDSNIIKYSSFVGMSELIKSGCTTCFDHHYVFKNQTNSDFIDTQFEVSKALNIRFHASRGSMSLSKKDGGLPPDSVVQNIDDILDDSQRLIKKYHDSSNNSMTQVALAPCSPFSVTKELMIESAKLARKHNVRLHTHLAETIDEQNYTLKHFNKRPLEYMDSLGWLGEDVWFAHGIHFDDDELKVLAKTKTGIAHCPISNMKLSSGIAQVPKILDLGIPLGLAVDGSASNDGSNLLEEIRMCYLLHRLNSSTKAPTGYDILKIATNGSAKILGRKKLGSLKISNMADLFMINKNRLEFVGANTDYKSLLGTVGLKNNVDMTMVNGKVIYKDNEFKTIDEEKLLYEAQNAFMNFKKHI